MNSDGNRLLASYMDFVEQGQELKYNFTGLDNKSVYNIYYAASEENPGLFLNYVDVITISLNATFIQASTLRRLMMGFLELLIILEIIL